VSGDPYREQELAGIHIEPDRRRLRFALTLGLGLVAGVALTVFTLRLGEKLATKEAQVSVTPAIERGPLEGRAVHLPPLPPDAPAQGPRVVHVWLQGCSDCMPAFEAMRTLAEHGGLGVPEVNVAYGSAEPAWAERYGVGKNLVVDPGTHVVSPLGISSFTTLVLDAESHVRLVDRPDRPGYADRVQGAYRALTSSTRPELTQRR
jgi:hypothetical protein